MPRASAIRRKCSEVDKGERRRNSWQLPSYGAAGTNACSEGSTAAARRWRTAPLFAWRLHLHLHHRSAARQLRQAVWPPVVGRSVNSGAAAAAAGMGNSASAAAGAGNPGGVKAGEAAAFMQALVAGNVAAFSALLQKSPALIHCHSRGGENVWHAAATGGHVEAVAVVQAAVEAVLASQGKQERLKATVNHGFNQFNQAVNQVISSAVPLALPAPIALPMSTDLSVNAQTRDGFTPLMAAVKASKPAAVKQLLAAGADAWLGDNSGATALHHAVWNGNVVCVRMLLQHAEAVEAGQAADECQVRLIDSITNTGLTPLHYAAWRGHLGILTKLINAGAALAAPSSSDTMGAVAANAGSTPMHLAAMKGHLAVVKLLLRANARLLALAAAHPAVVAEAGATSGAQADVRTCMDRYGKRPADLAWSLQRSDLALLLDPSTSLQQALQLSNGQQHISSSNPDSTEPAGSSGGSSSGGSGSSGSSGSSGTTSSRAGGMVAAAAAGVSVLPPLPSDQQQHAIAAGSLTTCQQVLQPCGSIGSKHTNSSDDFGGFIAAHSRLTKLPPPHLTCPITNDLLHDPVRACDGNAYEREAIEVWFALGNKLFPTGRAPISSQVLIPDEPLRQAVLEFLQAHQQCNEGCQVD